jgi:hypothetical protein
MLISLGGADGPRREWALAGNRAGAPYDNL